MSRHSVSVLFRGLSRSICLVGIAALLLACGGGDAEPSEADAADATATDTAATVIDITMSDHAYEPSEITVPAGKEVTLSFTNEGKAEHYFVVGDAVDEDEEEFDENLFNGVDLEKSKQAEGHDDDHDDEHEEEHEDEHHENEFELPPGGSGSLTFTLPPSKAGTYTIACFEETGGKTHYEMGMEGTLTVTTETE